MNEENINKKYFDRFLGKYIFVSKKYKNHTLLFRGYCLEVMEDKIILDDIKEGVLPLSYDFLSVTGVKE